MQEETPQGMVTGSKGYKVRPWFSQRERFSVHPKYVTIRASLSISLFLSFQIHKRILIAMKTLLHGSRDSSSSSVPPKLRTMCASQ